MAALTDGCNHVALVTGDMERFLDFYATIFNAETILDLREGLVRHALVDLGGGFCLHPFEFEDGHPDAEASATMFGRGHLDHLAINVSDPEVFELLRSRLVEAGATDGEVTDFGTARTVWFHDPDGMGCEIAAWSGGEARTLEDAVREAYVPAGVSAQV